MQHVTAAVSATAPPAELAVSSADAVFPLYKRLQNGSDIRGIAVDGKFSCGSLCSKHSNYALAELQARSVELHVLQRVVYTKKTLVWWWPSS